MYNWLIEKRRIFGVLLFDIIVVMLSILGAYLLRFDFIFPGEYLRGALLAIIIAIPLKVGVFTLFGMYRGMYRYTSLWDMVNILKATGVSSLLLFTFVGLLTFLEGTPRSIFLLDYILTTLGVGVVRISVRLYYSHVIKNPAKKGKRKKVTKLLLLGAGNTGDKILREINTSYSDKYEVVGFLDDKKSKVGARLQGVPVLGYVEDIKHISVPFDEILITAPTATGDEIRRMVHHCKATGKRYRTVPGFAELINNEVSIKSVRDVSLTDLLGREEVSLDKNSIDNFLRGKRVLVTGAGGSIGSELVRQCLGFNPGLLMLLDNSEQNLFNIEQEMEEKITKVTVKSILANIRDKELMEKILSEYRPQVILHAAAYKHVPMQEVHPWYAVLTNVEGSLNIMELAEMYDVDKFVLVSTDKAVRPANVMGATKRLSEILVQSLAKKSRTQFLAVRFGNVIGSSGSVIPTFQRQIEKGGPVTVTHPEMIRYFMSIPEAAQLILQTGAIGYGGEVFVLDMGAPIKIKDMAYDLIRLSGFEPEKEIPVIYTGLRPGEKMYEELVTHGEKVDKTIHPKIMIMKDGNSHNSWHKLKSEIEKLVAISRTFKSDAIKQKLQQLIPEYEPQGYYPPIEDINLTDAPSEIKSSTIKGQA